MKQPIVTLIRRFLPAAPDKGDWEFLSSAAMGPAQHWRDLDAMRRVLVLAAPGAGKTFEAKTHAESLVTQGKHAFFIRIEKIGIGFDKAFEVGSADDFDNWLNGTDEAWFFLDSVDEAQIETPRALEQAIITFSQRIQKALDRIHVVITSREDAWSALSDRSLVTTYLPHGEPSEEPQLKIFQLAPMKLDEIKLFSARFNVDDVSAFIGELQRSDLMSRAERPFDLIALIQVWKADRKLGSRLEMLQRLNQLYVAHLATAASACRIPRDRALAGARSLAAAVTLTGSNVICLPLGQMSAERIDPALVLPDWSPDEINALLHTGLFDDVVYGSVRFRHREARELLTAEWARDLVVTDEGRIRVENLFFRHIYDTEVIVARLRPTLSWLILFDEKICRQALRLSSEIATEGGDPSHLPLIVRREILADIARRIASDRHHVSMIDNTAIARIAAADLSAEVEALVSELLDNDDAIFFLGRFVWQGKLSSSVSKLLTVAISPDRGLYARIAAIRAVMTTGDIVQQDELWQAVVNSSHPLDRRLLAELLEDENDNAARRLDHVLRAIEGLRPYKKYEVTGLREALRQFINRLPIMADGVAEQPLLSLAEGMNSLLEHEPHVERGECKVSKNYSWLMASALRVVERLVESRSSASLSAAAISILSKAPILKYWADEGDLKESSLKELVPRWHELNDRLYWGAVAARRAMEKEPVLDDWRLTMFEHFWSFGAADFDRCLAWITERQLVDDQRIALSRCFALYVQNGKPVEWLKKLQTAVDPSSDLSGTLNAWLNPPPSRQQEWEIEHQNWEKKRDREERRNARDRAVWIGAIKADPERIRNPRNAKPGDLTGDQLHLMLSITGEGLSSHYEARANWQALTKEFGLEIAEAFRDAAVAHWRQYRPKLRSEGADTQSTPYSLIFAMVGLAIEAGEDGSFRAGLSKADAEHAFRYIGWELNGFPSWFEAVYRQHPAEGLAAVKKELLWDLEAAKGESPRHYILHDIVYHAPWLFEDVAPVILEWFADNELSEIGALDHALTILQRATVTLPELARLAERKLKTGVEFGQRPRWLARWVASEPSNGIFALQTELENLDPTAATLFAQQFVVALLGSRGSGGGMAQTYRVAAHLKTLYILMHRFIRSDEDIDRANTGVYSPELRDDAQEARNRLFTMLSEIPGKETYKAMKSLESEHPAQDYRSWMAVRAQERAIADADEPLWTADQIPRFMRFAIA